MNPAAPYRAWRFHYSYSEQDQPDAPTGLGLSPSHGIEMVSGDESVRQAIFLLLSTIPGERVMRPEYGCLLHRLVFAPNDDTTAGLAIFYARQALERWEPRVEITLLDAGRNPENPEYLDIYLEYRVRETQDVDALLFTFDLAGG
jgi:uncharacterized protein